MARILDTQPYPTDQYADIRAGAPRTHAQSSGYGIGNYFLSGRPIPPALSFEVQPGRFVSPQDLPTVFPGQYTRADVARGEGGTLGDKVRLLEQVKDPEFAAQIKSLLGEFDIARQDIAPTFNEVLKEFETVKEANRNLTARDVEALNLKPLEQQLAGIRSDRAAGLERARSRALDYLKADTSRQRLASGIPGGDSESIRRTVADRALDIEIGLENALAEQKRQDVNLLKQLELANLGKGQALNQQFVQSLTYPTDTRARLLNQLLPGLNPLLQGRLANTFFGLEVPYEPSAGVLPYFSGGQYPQIPALLPGNNATTTGNTGAQQLADVLRAIYSSPSNATSTADSSMGGNFQIPPLLRRPSPIPEGATYPLPEEYYTPNTVRRLATPAETSAMRREDRSALDAMRGGYAQRGTPAAAGWVHDGFGGIIPEEEFLSTY